MVTNLRVTRTKAEGGKFSFVQECLRQTHQHFSRGEREKRNHKHWLGTDAEIIHDKMFERAIERLHAGEKIDDLPLNLKRKVEHFKSPAAASAAPADPNRHFLSVALDECVQGSEVSFQHFLRTNNISERIFSRCKLIMTDHRRLMDPSTLETFIMLRANKELWDERDVEWILSNPEHFQVVDEETTVLGGARLRDDRDDVSAISTQSHSGREVRQCTSSSSSFTSSSAR